MSVRVSVSVSVQEWPLSTCRRYILLVGVVVYLANLLLGIDQSTYIPLVSSESFAFTKSTHKKELNIQNARVFFLVFCHTSAG